MLIKACLNGGTTRAQHHAVPQTPAGVTTGLWAAGGHQDRRMALVSQWTGTVQPDFASVNWSEPGADELAELLGKLGIAVEAGIWSVADAARLADGAVGDHVLRILIEPMDDLPGAAVATAAGIEAALDGHGFTSPRLQHGEGPATWAVLRAAIKLGRDIRVGLEDTTVLPDGRLASGNAELIQAAASLVAELSGHS